MADKLSEGQDVSWKWGGGNAKGKVSEIVTEGKAEVTSNKVRRHRFSHAMMLTLIQGNTVSRNAKGEDDPAVKISRDGVSTLASSSVDTSKQRHRMT